MGVGVYETWDDGTSAAIDRFIWCEIGFDCGTFANCRNLVSHYGNCTVFNDLALVIHGNDNAVSQEPINWLGRHLAGSYPFVT